MLVNRGTLKRDPFTLPGLFRFSSPGTGLTVNSQHAPAAAAAQQLAIAGQNLPSLTVVTAAQICLHKKLLHMSDLGLQKTAGAVRGLKLRCEAVKKIIW